MIVSTMMELQQSTTGRPNLKLLGGQQWIGLPADVPFKLKSEE